MERDSSTIRMRHSGRYQFRQQIQVDKHLFSPWKLMHVIIYLVSQQDNVLYANYILVHD